MSPRDPDLEAWFFVRADGNYVLHSHRTGSARYEIAFQDGSRLAFTASGRAYLKTSRTYDELRAAFAACGVAKEP